MKFLITYDIRDPKRWSKVYKIIQKEGLNVQLSCFEVQMSYYMLEKFLDQLAKYIDSKQDSIYAYPISESSFLLKLGKMSDLNNDYVL